MDQSRVRYLITKFRAGEITEREKEELETCWHVSVQEHQTIDFLNKDEKSVLQDALFDHISTQIGSSPGNNNKRRMYYGIAASLSAILLAVLVLYQYYYTTTLAYTTAYGETKKIVLPDSSVVTLNANTTLKIPEDWDQHVAHRKVWLEGEAFFEVKKANGATFTVFAGEVAVEVLGTSFNVQDRRGQTQVVLNTGKVKLKLAKEKQVLTMQPGDLVRFTEQQEKVEKRLVDPEIYSSWKEHTLIFQDKSLKDIALMLEDNYGYEVQIKNAALQDRRFTGSVPSDDIDMLLDKLSRVFNININKRNHVITLE